MIQIIVSGSNKTESSLAKMQKIDVRTIMERAGAAGVSALRNATPVDSGLTANSWSYLVEYKRGNWSIIWINTNAHTGVPVAILIQYGHGTGTGGWVQGRDYINPSIRPIFEKIASDVWNEVKNA